MIFRNFMNQNIKDFTFIKDLFYLLEDIICLSLMDYKDYLNSSFIANERKYLEFEYNGFLKTNKHIIKGFCFLKMPLIVYLNIKHKLQLDFSKIFFKLEYYLSVQYTDYYIIAQIYVRNKFCMKYIKERKGSLLNKLLKKAMLSDKITQMGFYQDFDCVQSINIDSSDENKRDSHNFLKLNSYRLFPKKKKRVSR